MKIIIRIFKSMILLITMIGVSGCMSQPTEEENKANELAMLNYLKTKYNEEFTSVEYIPAKRGFNDDYNQNILVAKSKDGILVNVRETLGKQGKYFDDYVDSYASKIFQEKIDYSSIKNLGFAKTYIVLQSDDISLDQVQSAEFEFNEEVVSRLLSLIWIPEHSNEEILKNLYGIYEQMQEFGFENTFFRVAFSGDPHKAEKYVNNYYIYAPHYWETYDPTISEILKIRENGLSYEEFKDRLMKVEG